MATAVTSRMADGLGKQLSSPQTKKNQIKVEDKTQTLPSIVQPDDQNTTLAAEDNKGAAPKTNAPLAPPPRPSETDNHFGQNGHKQEGKDFSSREPNPFEIAFGAPSDTPGKPQLPGVTSLTSPAALLGASTPGWPGSLRSGPLSPAMLTGPTSSDYFNSDHHYAGSFPTPNESSLRTGLTPGGGGSMFPQPSPNSQAMFQAIQSGGATPGTLDFHRTAMHARAASHANNNTTTSSAFGKPANTITSAPQDHNIQPGLDGKGFVGNNGQSVKRDFERHDANDAANGLYMLAQASNNGSQQQGPQYPPQQAQMNYLPNARQNQTETPTQPKRGAKGSIGSNLSGSTQHGEEAQSDSGEDTKPPRGGRGTKAPVAAKGAKNSRKAEDTPKASNKRQKSNSGMTMMDLEDEEESDNEDHDHDAETGRKLTDEEKRKNFLERNRIAALKCRQRKKQWLANLQHKVEVYSTENDALAATVTQLREEIVGLKTLLLAHKDCPVSQAQGISGMAMQNIAGDAQQYAYGMPMQGMPQHGMAQANMQRR